MTRRFMAPLLPRPRRGTPMSFRRLRTCRECNEWRALTRGLCSSCTARAAAAAPPPKDAPE